MHISPSLAASFPSCRQCNFYFLDIRIWFQCLFKYFIGGDLVELDMRLSICTRSLLLNPLKITSNPSSGFVTIPSKTEFSSNDLPSSRVRMVDITSSSYWYEDYHRD